MSSDTTKPANRRFFWLKLGVSVALIALLIPQIRWPELVETLRNADLRLVALYVTISPLMLLVSSKKWQLFLSAKAIAIGLPYLYRVYFIGHFFNHFMPSNVGGDLVRIYELNKKIGDFSEAAASVFVERMTGLAVLLAFAGVAVVGNLGLLGDTRVLSALGVGLLGYGVVLWLLLQGEIIVRVPGWFERTPLRRLARPLQELNTAVQRYRETPRVWIPSVALSIGFYFLVVTNAWVGCRAFGLEAPLTSLLLIIPVALLVVTIPISIGGIGLLEWGYFTLFEQMGLPGTVGLSVALMNRTCGLLMGGFGGILYSITPNRREDEYASV